MINLLQFLKEVLRDYARRFWLFWIILYFATVLLELARQVFLEGLSAAAIFGLHTGGAVAGKVLLDELLVHPYLVLPLIFMFLFNAWGFGALYYSFSGLGFSQAISRCFKNLHRYVGYIIVASGITFLGFFLLPQLAVWLLDAFTDVPVYLANDTLNLWIVLPLFFVFGLPGLYFLVAFANGPFILLLEEKSIFQSLLESARRVTPRWFLTALYLLAFLIIAGIAYYLLMRLIFSLKLVLIPDLSLRGESMLRVFLYSIPWVIVASFYDLVVYYLYKMLAFENLGTANNPMKSVESGNHNLNFFTISPAVFKTISIFVLIAFVTSFVLVPIPAHAGGFIGYVFSIIAFVAACTILAPPTAGTSCAFAISVASITIATITLTSVVVGGIITQGISGGACAGMGGSYDPIFGTCTTKEKKESQGQQEVRCSNVAAKFTKVKFPDIPTPSEFAADPNSTAPVTFNWNADARPGLVNYFDMIDTKTAESFRSKCTNIGNQCSSGPVTSVCQLPYEREFTGKIWAASCFQIGAKSVTPTCSGCGGDVDCANYKLTTPSLPLPRVDIKANGKDGDVVFKIGVPIKLSWISEYALSCEAQGSWSGAKSTSGSQTITPSAGNEVYTLVCKRGDKSGSDSVSSAPANKQIQIFGTKGGASGGGIGGGGIGGLNISSFNISQPLNPGDTVTISWSVQNAESCEVDNGIGKIPTVGSVNATFLRTITFTMTCKDSAGNTVSAKRTVDVRKIPKLKEILPE